MTDCIEQLPRSERLVQVKIGVKNARLLSQRSGEQAPVRCDDAAPPGISELAGSGQLFVEFEVRRIVGLAQDNTD
jgi:hypothetical protein